MGIKKLYLKMKNRITKNRYCIHCGRKRVFAYPIYYVSHCNSPSRKVPTCHPRCYTVERMLNRRHIEQWNGSFVGFYIEQMVFMGRPLNKVKGWPMISGPEGFGKNDSWSMNGRV